jgi:hypothetical protein
VVVEKMQRTKVIGLFIDLNRALRIFPSIQRHKMKINVRELFQLRKNEQESKIIAEYLTQGEKTLKIVKTLGSLNPNVKDELFSRFFRNVS